MAIVIFTPLNTIFGLVYLPYYMYFIGLGMALVPLVIMELSKLLGFIKHESHKK